MGAPKKQQLKKERQEVVEKVEVQDNTNEYIPPNASLLKEKIISSIARGESKEGEEPKEKEAGYIGEAHNDEEAQARLRNREEEKIFDEMEGLMREASRIREISRSGTLTDDERRERAGEAATLMMDLMTKLEFGEEDSDEEENHPIPK
mmetsp:Transcript_3350/g.7452  ORF Transcript_3350/g.7452 Transcript_3350/m.7452 type:complete len:149 (-) Transcript_3350:2060-2506(-)